MSSPLIWSTGRYESMGERIASSAAEVVDAADRCAPVRDAALLDLACGAGKAALVAALPRCTRDRGGHHVPVIGCGRELRDEGIADTRVLCSATSMPQNANRCGRRSRRPCERGDDAGVRFDAPYVVVTARRR